MYEVDSLQTKNGLHTVITIFSSNQVDHEDLKRKASALNAKDVDQEISKLVFHNLSEPRRNQACLVMVQMQCAQTTSSRCQCPQGVPLKDNEQLVGTRKI